MIRKLKLIFLCVVLIVIDIQMCWSESSHPEILQPFIEQDRKDLISSINGDVSRIFFVKIFDRLIPVPNRYVLKVNETGRHVFKSMTGETIGRALLIGTIEAGMVAKGGETGFRIKQEEYELLYDNYDGMGVKVFKRKSDLDAIKEILISDGVEYLVILDQDHELWKYMIDASRRF